MFVTSEGQLVAKVVLCYVANSEIFVEPGSFSSESRISITNESSSSQIVDYRWSHYLGNDFYASCFLI